jgi:hypothetical protein
MIILIAIPCLSNVFGGQATVFRRNRLRPVRESLGYRQIGWDRLWKVS